MQKKCTDCTFRAGNDFCKDRFDHSDVPKVKKLRSTRNTARNDVECHDNDRNGKRQGLCAIEDESNGISRGKMTCIGFYYKAALNPERHPRPELKIVFNDGRGEIHYHLDDDLQIQTGQVKKPALGPLEDHQQLNNSPNNQYVLDLYNECKAHIERDSVEWEWKWGAQVGKKKNFFPGKRGRPEVKTPENKETFTRYVTF